jgi:general secretion pathway protein D
MDAEGASRAVRSGYAVALAALLSACAQAPIQPGATHLRAPPPAPEGQIPAPVLAAPALPLPKPAPRAETYSVVVHDVPVQDLLFALARDAKLNVDIQPGIAGRVTLNAIDQTLPQLLNRIAKQVDMRWELDGPNLAVMRDTPYLRTYKVDYVSASRNVRMQSTASTQFAAGAAGAPAAPGSGTGAVATVDVVSKNELWDAIVQNVKEILRETDKIVPVSGTAATAPAAPPAAAPTPQPGAPAAPAASTPPAPAVEFREAASVIGNRESGVLFVRATSRQHEKVQEFLDQVLASTRRQVLIEATIVEVQLNNLYERGIDWQRLRPEGSSAGFTFRQSPAGTPAGVDTATGFVLGYATGPGVNLVLRALKLLESFGDVRVLSSPQVSVLNNQIALLRVTRDIVYFTITPSTTPITIVPGTGGANIQLPFSTTPQVAAEGFMMSVLPQVSEGDTIVLNVRPTIRRRVGFAQDPNPALTTVQNLVPVFETRELDSILRLQSGQVAVLGGLMQDQVENTEDAIPGVRALPGIGPLFAQRKDLTRKTELVIFLRATVLRDPSVTGDFRGFLDQLPGEDFFRKPNPGRAAPVPGT